MPGNGDICYQISTHRSLRNKARSRPGDPLAVFPAHFFFARSPLSVRREQGTRNSVDETNEGDKFH